MRENSEFERFRLLFRRASALPPLPSTALRLISAIDGGDASALDLERIIDADPPVAAQIISLTGHSLGDKASTTIRQAIMQLGQRPIRAMAVSLTLKSMLKSLDSEGFDAGSFAKHSLTVAFGSRYLFARSSKVGRPISTNWSADEIFAAGLLHDLSYPLLAMLAPDALKRVSFTSRRLRVGLDEAFIQTYGESMIKLGAEAASAWKLPEPFVTVQTYLAQPWMCVEQFDALSCISFADYLANTAFDAPAETWPCDYEALPEVQSAFDLQENEIEILKEAVVTQLETVRASLQCA